MQFDLRQMAPPDCYKILGGSVTPRPIAWVTTQSAAGVRNAAPYSFFNVMGHEPPTVALGLLGAAGGGFKDTAANILETGEFVINLVAEADAAAMNLTCMDAPPEVDELDCAGITTAPSLAITPPRIASAPVSFECRLLEEVHTGASQVVVIGEVLVAHIADVFLLDAERLHIDAPAMRLVARMHGAGWYTRSTDLFQLERPTYSGWMAERRLS
jgi:flavin reductase (DIM6/NTAB) family NADH-FMN oxidoreductase RutF